MNQKIDATLVGEVRCVNCGRTLGELVRNISSDRLGLRPAGHRTELLVRVEGGRVLRCVRCQGRAFVEATDSEPVIERRSVRTFRGAA